MNPTKFTSLNQLKVYTHISENIREGVWISNWIEFQEIKDKYLISQPTASRCIKEMVTHKLLDKVGRGIYKLILENTI